MKKKTLIISLALLTLGLGCNNGGSSDPCINAAAGLVSWWPGDGDTMDIAGSNDGMLQGTASFVAGFVRQAFDFDGSGAHVSVLDDDSLDGFSGITVDAWIRTTNSVGNRAILSKYDHSSGSDLDDSYYLGLNDGAVLWQINAGDSFNIVGNMGTDYADGNFHHIAGTWDGTDQIIYVDGNLVFTQAYSGTGPINATSEPVAIGRSQQSGAPGNFFDGLIDEVGLYNRALDAMEIQAIFDAGSGGRCKS